MHDYIVLHSAKRQESNMKDLWHFVVKSGVRKGEQERAGGNELIVKLHLLHAAESLPRGFWARYLKHACGLYHNVATCFSHSSSCCQMLVDKPQSTPLLL